MTVANKLYSAYIYIVDDEKFSIYSFLDSIYKKLLSRNQEDEIVSIGIDFGDDTSYN